MLPFAAAHHAALDVDALDLCAMALLLVKLQSRQMALIKRPEYIFGAGLRGSSNISSGCSGIQE